MFEKFYGLTGRPFQLTPDPKFYFESLTHRKALSYLSYGLAQGEGFVVITGEVGAGKSTLVAHLMATVDPARLTAAQIVTSRLDAEELVHLVAQAFGLIVDGHDKASALGAIEAFLHDEARAGRRCLLVVDESQNLSLDALEELRMLSNFQLGAHPLLQTLLLGQPEFRETIHDHPRLEQLRQRVIAAHHLEAIEPGEVQPYVEHRLRCVGWQGNPAFDPAFFVLLHEASGGVPRKINQICNRVMMQGGLDHLPRIEATTLRAVLAELDRDGALRLNQGEAADAPEGGHPVGAEAPEAVIADGAHAAEADATSTLAAPFFAAPSAASAEPPLAQPAVAEHTTPTSEGPAWVARAELEALLAERDHEIAALRQEIAALGLAPAGLAPGLASLGGETRHPGVDARFVALEAKLAEQEQTIRQTLTMLIEWIESDDASRAAA